MVSWYNIYITFCTCASMTHRNKVLSSLTLALPHKISAFEQALRLVKNVKKLVKFLTSTCKKDEHTDKHCKIFGNFKMPLFFVLRSWQLLLVFPHRGWLTIAWVVGLLNWRESRYELLDITDEWPIQWSIQMISILLVLTAKTCQTSCSMRLTQLRGQELERFK